MLTQTINSSTQDHTSEWQRNAYNAAFYELGLRWHWDAETYQALSHKEDEKERIRFYLENHQPHLLKAYDADFLIEAIQSVKSRCYQDMGSCGDQKPAFVNWAEMHTHEVGV